MDARAEAHFDRGKALYQQNDFNGALEAYSEAVKLNPDYSDAHCNRGNVLQVLGDLKGALKAYDEAIRSNPNNSDAHCNRSVVLKVQGDLKGALKAFGLAMDCAINSQNYDSLSFYLTHANQMKIDFILVQRALNCLLGQGGPLADKPFADKVSAILGYLDKCTQNDATVEKKRNFMKAFIIHELQKGGEQTLEEINNYFDFRPNGNLITDQAVNLVHFFPIITSGSFLNRTQTNLWEKFKEEIRPLYEDRVGSLRKKEGQGQQQQASASSSSSSSSVDHAEIKLESAASGPSSIPAAVGASKDRDTNSHKAHQAKLAREVRLDNPSQQEERAIEAIQTTLRKRKPGKGNDRS